RPSAETWTGCGPTAGWKRWRGRTPGSTRTDSPSRAGPYWNESCRPGGSPSSGPTNCSARRGAQPRPGSRGESGLGSESGFVRPKPVSTDFGPNSKEETMALPTPGLVIEQPRTALVITDLQNDFLSPGGAAWGLVKDSLAANNTVENIEALLRAARDGGYPVFLSPHYYYPSDGRWVAPGGALEVLMSQLGVFARKGPLTLDGFAGSGADWPERFKPYLQACDTVGASPHKVYGTSSNDLVLQLRKRR